MTIFAGANLTKTYTAAQLLNEGDGHAVGDTYVDREGKKYKFVLHNNGAGNIAAAVGDWCYYYAPSGASAGAMTTVTSDLSDSANVGAGLWQAIVADASYGWIQTWGSATQTSALTAGADGNALTAVGASDGTVDVSAAVTDFICAVAIDASAKIIFLTCP